MPPKTPPVILHVQARRQALMAQEGAAFEDLTRAWVRLEDAVDGDLERLARDLSQARADHRRIDSAYLLGLSSFVQLYARLRQAGAQFGANAAGRITQMQAAFAQAGPQDAAAALALLGVQQAQIGPPVPVSALPRPPGVATSGAPIDTFTGQSWRYGAQNLLASALRPALSAAALSAALRTSLALGLQHTLTVARTESWATYRSAQDVQYQASGVVRAYRRLSRRDRSVCVGCLAADGWIYPEGDDFESHPNCRCVKVPIVAGKPNAEFPSGREWFEAQDAETQRMMLGSGRYDKWRQGQAFGDFARVRHEDGHYTTIGPTPIRDLR
jgi:hypothetical protein